MKTDYQRRLDGIIEALGAKRPRLLRRKIMSMSVADEADVFIFPDDIPVNIAMAEDTDPAAVQVELCDTDGYVWENPPVKLRLPGYKALYSYPPYPRKTMDLYSGPVDVHMEQEIELVPYGCTNLRISYIPRAKLPLAPMPYGADIWRARMEKKNQK